jgi:hypothetical protein
LPDVVEPGDFVAQPDGYGREVGHHGLRTDRSAQIVIAGIAFVQNLRRGHYELATEAARPLRVAAAFTERDQPMQQWRMHSDATLDPGGNEFCVA